jgi:hypothetical protein
MIEPPTANTVEISTHHGPNPPSSSASPTYRSKIAGEMVTSPAREFAAEFYAIP